MNCSTCVYKKNIPVFSKCAGVPGRTRVGTAYYCSHPDIKNPVPVITSIGNILEDCPVHNVSLNIKNEIQSPEVTES